MTMRARVVVSCVALAVVAGVVALDAQGRAGAAPQGRAGGPPAPPATPKEAAPIDLTGYWVSIVNEDYRWRMITPPKGDYSSVPLNDEGKKLADTWDPSKDGRCEAFGAAALMRMPTRLHITWESDNVLEIDTDSGQQTRRFVFDRAAKPPVERTLQGFSQAEWQLPPPAPGAGRGRGPARGPAPGSSLKVVTSMLRPAWLRRNGVPYSENAALTEYFDRFTSTNGDEWLAVTTIVSDPKYLNQDFITSSHFKREPDGSKWNPFACKNQ